MAEEQTPPTPPSTLGGMMQEAQALDDAIARAKAQLDAIHAAAFEADQIAKQGRRCTVHEVPGVGRYAVPHKRGWLTLLELLDDRSVDIDFNADKYPCFDAIIVQHTHNSPLLNDPLHFQYDNAENIRLRQNLAAVRNFLMETYYANTPPGMTPDKAQKAMMEIAAFVGDGLYNNKLFLGVLPNHAWNKPFIDMNLASQPDGKGAQYIYDKILEMQRQSSWIRPFEAVVALFGGKQPVDWMLPSGTHTPFGHEAVNAAPYEQATTQLQATSAMLQRMRDDRVALQERMDASAMAVDLEAMGNQLLHTAEQLQQGVDKLAEPVKRDAIEIAKDILRKLKVGFGSIDLTTGMNLKPKDDMAALGAVQGVAMVYEKLLAWGRGIDASIAQHPSIIAATMAVGQMGYLAKLEALRMAQAVGNGMLADRIAQRIATLPDVYKSVGGLKFADLLNRVEGGIDTVLNRIQEINGPGAVVGFTRSNELGNYMNGTPIAGLSGTVTTDGVNNKEKKNAAFLQSQDTAERAQAQAIQSQAASRQRQSGQGQQPAQQQQARGTGRQQLRQARQQQTNNNRSTNTTNSVSTAMLTQAQLAQRNAAWRAAHMHDHDGDHDHDGHPGVAPVRIDPRLVNPALMKQIKATGINTNDLTTGKAAFNKMQNANTQGLKPSATPNLKAKPAAAHAEAKPVSEEEKKKQELLDQVAPGAPKGHGGHSR